MGHKTSYQFPFAKYPAVRIALLFIAGILLGRYGHVSHHVYFGVFISSLFISIITEYILRKRPVPRVFSVTFILYICGLISFGALWQTTFNQQTKNASAKLLSAYTWEDIQIKGNVYNIKQTSTGKYQLDIKADTTIIQDSLQWVEPYRLRAVLATAGHAFPQIPELGSRIHVLATVYPLEPKRNPYGFDYKQYLASQNIYTQVGLQKIYSVQPNRRRLSWNRLRQEFLTLIDQNFTGQTVPLAKALLMGYKNELDRDQKIAFSRVGLSHIMAVSGLHVGFLLAPFWFLIPFLWTLRRGKEFGLAFLVLLLVGYAGLTGFSASVMRASITGGFITYGRLFHKARDSKNLTAVAAIILLLINPNDLFEIGFQLSFAAVYIILLIIPVLQQLIPNKIRYRWYGVPLMVVMVSIVVQIGLYPMLSYYFGEFSLAGPVANALVVPALSFVVPYALFLLPISALLPSAGYVLNAPCRWFLHFLQWLVTTMSGWNWSWIQTPTTGLFVFLIWIAAIFFIANLFIPKLRWKMLVLLLLLLCLQQGNKLYETLQPPQLKVTMLDVGQGDATFITTPSGKHILIDTGRWTPDYNSAKYVIIPHLKALGVQKLDAVFLSHPHADHIGGMTELINTMPIDTIYNSGFAYHSELYKTYLKEAKLHHIPVKSLHAGMEVWLDPAIKILVYAPSPANTYSDPNEHSLVAELIYGKTQFLFMGDGGGAEESLLLKNYADMIDTDFLKVGHHGSRTASSVSFLKVATPNISAVSLAKINRFGHPHAEAVNHFYQSGTSLYYTSLEGALEFASDGRSIKKIPWH